MLYIINRLAQKLHQHLSIRLVFIKVITNLIWFHHWHIQWGIIWAEKLS